MSKISDLANIALRELIGNMVYTKGGLAIGTAVTGINTTAAIQYAINGVMQAAKAAMTSQSIAVTHTDDGRYAGGSYVQPSGTTVYYTLSLGVGGAVSVTQGSYIGQTFGLGQSGTSAAGDGSVPNAPAGTVPFGVIKVVTTGAATFTPGTTALNAANVAATYFDIAVMPAGLL